MTKTAAPDAAGAPADSPEPPKAQHPTKGRRYAVLDGEGGDVCIVVVVGKDHKTYPPGTMLPIENVPRFQTATEAKKWVKNDSGDLLAGMQVMVFQAKELMSIQVENKPTVKITEKPKRQIAGPEPE